MFTLNDLVKDKRELEKNFERKDIVKTMKKLFPNMYEIPKPIRPSSKGTPDRQFVIPNPNGGFGIFIAIETKRSDGKPTAKQLERIRAINNAGGIALVAYTWEEVESILIEKGVLKNVQS